MNLNKAEALVLAKVLHQHGSNSLSSNGNETEFQATIEDLEGRLQQFLVNDSTDIDISPYEAGDLIRLGSILHDLTPVKTTEGLVEFELFDERTTVIIDGHTAKEIESIDSIRLGRSHLEVLCVDGRRTFTVNQSDWPADWLKYMAFDVLYKLDHR